MTFAKRERAYEIAVHEAGHAVVAHLVGIAIDHVLIRPDDDTGYSRPVRDPVAAKGDRMWAEATAIRRGLIWGQLTDRPQGKGGWLLRKGIERRYWKYNYRTGKYTPRKGPPGVVTIHGTPAPQLARRADRLTGQASAKWKAHSASLTRRDCIRDLMHTLGGPVADCVFFNAPFEPPKGRWRTLEEMEARKSIGPLWFVYSGNAGTSSDFRSMRGLSKLIDADNWQTVRERYRRKCEKLVRQHKTAIERVARALLKRKTLTGAELTKLINK